MPPLIVELHGSRTFDVNVTGGTAKFLYYIGGVESEADAYDMVLANAPETWYLYTRTHIDMTNRPTLDQWWPVVNYEVPVHQPGIVPPTGDGPGGESPPPGGGTSTPTDNEVLGGVSVSISLENIHVNRSIETISRTGIGGAATPDVRGLIGVTQDGKVEGVDIGIPVATIQVKSTLPYLTAGYFKNLLWVCGKTNESAWWLFDQEEALFAGAQGQSKGSGECEINYEFKFQKSRSNITIRPESSPGAGDEIVVPMKRGWQYMWTMNRAEKDTAANILVERPYAAYVEQVYDKVNFDWLGKIR